MFNLISVERIHGILSMSTENNSDFSFSLLNVFWLKHLQYDFISENMMKSYFNAA